MPVSPCGPDCVPPATGPIASAPVVAARLCALAAVLLGTLVGVALLPGAARARWLCGCYRAVLRCCGVRLRVTGELGAGGELLAVNHLSWVEVLAVGSLRPVSPVAKREMGDWPVIGGVARRAGALFVDRAGLRGLPGTVAATAAALRTGADVAVFPEGTTWCGAAAGPFRRAVFQAAIDAGAPVRPVAAVLRGPDGVPAPAAAFVGEQTLWDSLRQVLRMPTLDCELTVLPALPPGADRRELARRAGEAVAAVTGVPHAVPRQSRTPAAA
ncbi:1-acyl-sn-glycerol-3-phosphate acyltransferase [Pseudonocardia kunmingensis]|uniref:1-acyl-sn-glycerol-3-phosphate acyltransferase n=1 Tax=Pseudonocardia kunmingensis TaxID=630975 RepID=A0A543DZY5_9PSEU|nr:1-acyl-sn-glycerol-3-phosphate acyltransferase [Pseudonocardia kunmingensis]